MNFSVIILAAGFGTRMKSQKAKVMNEICSKPMLYYVLKTAQSISSDVTCILGHQKDIVATYLKENFLDVNIIIQDTEKYPGTGGALRNIKPKYTKTLILNGDMPLITKEDLNSMLKSDSKLNLGVVTLKDATGYGRVIVNDSGIIKVVEHKDCNIAELNINLVNSGVYLCDSELLQKYIPKLSNNNSQKEYYLTDIIKMAKDDNITIKPFNIDQTSAYGVNSKFHLSYAEEIICKRIKRKWMNDGVKMTLPDTIYIEDDVKFIGECSVEPNCVLKGKTTIENSVIKSGSIVENATIIDSNIGPFARLRPKSKIAYTHIGNFVEIKNSELTEVKAGHLSYIGDATIDKGTNIGAGVITCNYDGINKHKTKIGKNVFIGSDSQLIAPITIADDTIIGAGTTLSKDIKEQGNLVVTRSPLKVLSNYFYKFFSKVN